MTDNNKTISKKKIIIIVVAAVLVLGGAAAGIIFARQGYLATTMRLLKAEGAVNIEDSKGGTKPVSDGLRFQTGDALNTGNDGLAMVGLDDKKIVTLDHDSRAEFQKKNKQLELKLTEGALFVNVTEKLKSDEKFEIKTSNMTAGIRGTLLFVYLDKKDSNREVAALLEGKAEISATNPVTHETKKTTLEANQMARVYFYNDRTENTVEFFVSEISEEDFTDFMIMIIGLDENLLSRIGSQNNKWTKDKLLEMLKNFKNGGVPPKEDPKKEDPDAKKPGESQKPVEPENPNNPDNPGDNPENPGDDQQPDTTKQNNSNNKKKTTKKVPKKPTVPSGYEKYVWNKKKNKYIVRKKGGSTYKGWINEKWVKLSPEMIETDTAYVYYFKYGKKTYYTKKVPYGSAAADTPMVVN